MIFDPSSPLDAIRKEFPRAHVDYDDGRNAARAAKAAEAADAVIVFADQYHDRNSRCAEFEPAERAG